MTTRRERFRFRRPFEGVPPQTWVPVVLLLVSVCITVYALRLLPGIEAMQCGADWSEEYKAWVGPDEIANTGDDVGIRPVCTSQIPAYLRPLSNLLPLLFFAPLPFVVLRQTGSVVALPAILLVLILRGMIPGDGLGEWAVAAVGMTLACAPMWTRGVIPALAHIGALAVWPTLALDMGGLLGSASPAPAAVDWVMEMVAWVVLPGVLMLAPLLPQRRTAE